LSEKNPGDIQQVPLVVVVVGVAVLSNTQTNGGIPFVLKHPNIFSQYYGYE
jgi:hypothetical protein